ncbi:DNA polymerase zeta catalytic subunit [Spatholobus suberectus]|nr:DNA polymerase zeta catalytic subunit [Spatholobus suberectus]
MGILSTLFSRRTPSLLNPQTLKPPPRPTTSEPLPPLGPTPQARPTKRPLHVLFAEAVGLSEKTAPTDDEASETATELKNNLRQLEQEVKTFKEKAKGVPQKRSLYAAFTYQQPPALREPKRKEPEVFKELSPDMVMFAQYLYEKGYFNDANFAKGRKSFDPAWFTNFFAVGYVKFAARKFARDNQEIAKWLSGSALKQVAVFGCPSTHRSGVFPAKKLRKFLEVPENTVCSGCSLQQSCKFVNQSVWKFNTNNLDLVTVMEVITSYALESVDPQLVVPDEVKKSVSQLLKEVLKLSQTT